MTYITYLTACVITQEVFSLESSPCRRDAIPGPGDRVTRVAHSNVTLTGCNWGRAGGLAGRDPGVLINPVSRQDEDVRDLRSITGWLTHQVGPMLGWCWTNVADGGPTSTQHWLNVPCHPCQRWLLIILSKEVENFLVLTQCFPHFSATFSPQHAASISFLTYIYTFPYFIHT